VAVLVVAHDVAAGTELDAHDVRVARVARALAPETAYRAPDDAAGRVASVALAAGTVVTPGLVAAGEVASRAPKGRVVVALSLGDDPAAALLGPGDHVDLLASTTDAATADPATDAPSGTDTEGTNGGDDPAKDRQQASRPTSSYLARRALVLPVARAEQGSGGGLLGSNDTAPTTPTVVVAVTAEEAEAIAGRPDWARVTAVLVR
jgi:Flp pilus assembly protein CpaB